MNDFDSFLGPSGDPNNNLDSLDQKIFVDGGLSPATIAPEGAGIDCELKRFSSTHNSKGDEIKLEAESMNNLKVEKERSISSALTLTQYWDQDKSVGRKELMIRSPYMKAALKAVVPAYRDFQVHLKHILIIGEPRCLFHFRDEFRMYCANLQDQTALSHVLFLMKYMCWELATQISLYRDNMIVDRGAESLNYQCLWMAFRPGDLVYAPAKVHEDEQIYRLISMEYKEGFFSTFEPIWSVKALCIVSDDNKFREYEVNFRIDQFNGIRQLRTLPIFPLKYHPEATHIQAQLLDRGKKFCSLHSSHYRQYNGVAKLVDDNKNLIIASEDEDPSSARPTMVRSSTAL